MMVAVDPTRVEWLPVRETDVMALLVTMETDGGERFCLHVPAADRQSAFGRAVLHLVELGHPSALPVDWQYA